MAIENITEEITLSRSLGSLVTTYEEIAVMRIQKIRKSVLATRAFRQELTGVFADVRSSRKAEVLRLLRKKKKGADEGWRGKPASEQYDPKSQVKVLMTGQERFSGSLTSQVVYELIDSMKDKPTDLIVVGDAGRDLLVKLRPEIKFQYFDLPDFTDPASALLPIAKELQNYENITLYYGRFVNLVDQIPARTQLFDEAALEVATGPSKIKKEQMYYLFEPTLAEVVDFFNRQIFAMLFKQTIDESRLAQLGSRITAMESASQNIKKHQQGLLVLARRMARQLKNTKQRQQLAGMVLWKVR